MKQDYYKNTLDRRKKYWYIEPALKMKIIIKKSSMRRKGILGLERSGGNDKRERVNKAFEAFRELHKNVLEELKDPGAEAVLAFLQKWEPERAAKHQIISPVLEEVTGGGNIVFRLQGDDGYIHERKSVADAWQAYKDCADHASLGQCLVSGETSPIARLHPSIKGVAGAQSSGASIVSYNLDAFTSYGKEQSYNASIGENAAFSYTTALNHLLSDRKHRIRIGDTTMVFWAERSTGLEEDLLGALFFPVDEEAGKKDEYATQIVRDPQTVQLLRDIFSRIRAGKPVSENLTGVDPEGTFYILGLAPNASRLAVRFWHVDRYGSFLDKIGSHYRDLELIRNEKYDPEFISISRILKETAPLGDTSRIPPLLGNKYNITRILFSTFVWCDHSSNQERLFNSGIRAVSSVSVMILIGHRE